MAVIKKGTYWPSHDNQRKRNARRGDDGMEKKSKKGKRTSTPARGKRGGAASWLRSS